MQVQQEGIPVDYQGAYFTYDLVAPDDVLNISLGGYNILATDNNPILDGLTLEIAPAGSLPGDFNNNSVLDAADIDLLSTEVRAGTNNPAYNLTADSLVNDDDRKQWVEVLKHTYFGDANLDGEFNSTDFVDVFVAGKYEDGIDGNAGWAEGDWDGSSDFDSSDFVAAFVAGGYEVGPRAPAAVMAVPEPSAALLMLLGLAVWSASARLRARQ